MKTKLLISLWFTFAGIFFANVGLADGVGGYHLNQGDVIQVSVWGEDTLQKVEAKVLPDGSITFPLAGRIEVAGLSSPDVEARIAEKLKKYIPEPHVTVIVTGVEGNTAYVLGKVIKPGPVVLSGPITVLQALSQAGGFDKFATLNKIIVIRKTPAGQKVIPIPYEKLLSGEDLDSNILLNAGDTILVP